MSDIKREDLRVKDCDQTKPHDEECFVPMSDADLAALGYVRLDDGMEIDYKAMWEKLNAETAELEAELADWQRHGVKVAEDCETCRKGKVHDPDCGCKRLICAYLIDCPDCGGTGKKLRDGVSWAERSSVDPTPIVYVIPAEWLEVE